MSGAENLPEFPADPPVQRLATYRVAYSALTFRADATFLRCVRHTTPGLFLRHREQFHYLLQAARALSLHERFESPRAPRRPTTPPILVFSLLFKREFQKCSVNVNGPLVG